MPIVNITKPAETVAVRVRRLVLDLDTNDAIVLLSDGSSEHIPAKAELVDAAHAMLAERYGELVHEQLEIDPQPEQERARHQSMLAKIEADAAAAAIAEESDTDRARRESALGKPTKP